MTGLKVVFDNFSNNDRIKMKVLIPDFREITPP